MEGCYQVYDENVVVGKVQIIRQGLYYQIICRCSPGDDMVRRLYADQDGTRENLGVLVPEGDGFLLDRKIPVKKLSGERVRFVLSTAGTKRAGKLVPVCPEEPFLYIDRLKNAFVETQSGKMCIRIEENPEAV